MSIAAASILAKTTRDALMRNLGRDYPGYGFGDHAGYATAFHRDALMSLGPCPYHRRSFRLRRDEVDAEKGLESVESADLLSFAPAYENDTTSGAGS